MHDCGNGIVEPGEDCDPGDRFNVHVYCDHTCHSVMCPPLLTTCGDGIVDCGESCEPPGVGGCAPDCHAASCGASAGGEIRIACDVPPSPASYPADGLGDVSAAATRSTYLVGWTEASSSLAIATAVRRFGVNGAPLDSGRTVLSTDVPCQSSHYGSALASDGHDFYAVWRSFGQTEYPVSYTEILGRRVGGGGGIGPLDHFDLSVAIGTREGFYIGPTMAAGVSPARFAVGWRLLVSDWGSFLFQDPIAQVVDFNAMPDPQSLDIGLTRIDSDLNVGSQSGANVAQLGADTIWVWHARSPFVPEPPYEHVVTAVFTDLAGAGPHVILSHRNELIGGRPGVSAGASSFLVAWGQGASAVATKVTEIRAVRATHAAGRLDPDGGLLLATSSTAITGGPVVAFDGTRWLVVWAEESGTTHDLRAVAVKNDGTVVDASRLVASDVDGGEPAVASAGDGRVLVVFMRPNGAARDVLATFVTP